MLVDNILVYIVVFLVVFVPYLFLSFFLGTPRQKAIDLSSRNIPPFYKAIWGLLSYFNGAFGSFSFGGQKQRQERLQNALIAASIKMDTSYVFAAEVLMCIVCSVGGVLLFLLFTRSGVTLAIVAIIAGVFGFVYPSTVIFSAAGQRQDKIMKALPFAIDLIGSAMRAGIDFTAAIRYYVSTEKGDAPLALEFGILLRQLELGKTRIEAIEEMASRIQTDAFSSFAAAVTHGLEVGASIVDTLKIQAEEMRRVRFNTAERKAARAVSAMILPIALFIMPAMFLIIGAPVLIKVFSSGLGGLMQ